MAYMSPEQVRAEDLDGRTDIYSFGVVLYEMATGRHAFSGSTSGIIFHAILERVPTSPLRLNPELPLDLDRIINKALEKDREARYQSAKDLFVDLRRLKRDTDLGRAAATLGMGPLAVRARSGLRWKMALVIGAFALFALLWFSSPHRAACSRPCRDQKFSTVWERPCGINVRNAIACGVNTPLQPMRTSS